VKGATLTFRVDFSKCFFFSVGFFFAKRKVLKQAKKSFLKQPYSSNPAYEIKYSKRSKYYDQKTCNVNKADYTSKEHHSLY